MRNSPVATVDPDDLVDTDRTAVGAALDVAKSSGVLDVAALPGDVRAQLFFALDAVARGKHVATVADGKPLTTTEAAEPMRMWWTGYSNPPPMENVGPGFGSTWPVMLIPPVTAPTRFV